MSGNKHNPVQATELGTVIKVDFSATTRFTRAIWNTVLIIFWTASLKLGLEFGFQYQGWPLKLAENSKLTPMYMLGIIFFDTDIQTRCNCCIRSGLTFGLIQFKKKSSRMTQMTPKSFLSQIPNRFGCVKNRALSEHRVI